MKWEAKINPTDGTSPLTVVVEANSYFDAERLIKAQYSFKNFYASPRPIS